MASRDGRRFHVWPEAFVRPGIQRPGNWYYGDAWYAWGLVETASLLPVAPPELSLYIQQRTRPAQSHADPGQLRRHTLRLDGFASVHAPLAGGVLITHPLRFSGCGLEINFSTSAGGSLRAEIQDEAGQPIPGFTLADCDLQYGDQLDRIVSWKSSAEVSQFAGRPINLRFEMKDADLYAIRFRPGE